MRLSQPGVLLLACALLLSTACSKSRDIERYQGFVFGTLVEIKLRSDDVGTSQRASSEVLQQFDTMHDAWHAWRPGALGRVNSLLQTGEWFTAPSSTLEVIEKSVDMYRRSDGLFNPAIGRLIALWGFHDDELPARPPAEEDIERLRGNLPNMDDIDIDGVQMRGRHASLQLDVGGIAKGLAVDIAIQTLQRHSIRHALVNAGGDLCGIGDRGGRPWRIGIRHPERSAVLGSIDLKDGECVFTSGDYERFFDYDGRHYHHIIDPRSGYPAESVRSVTVLHDDGSVADAASTALFIAGPDRWQEIASRMGISHVLLVDNNGRLFMTPAMADRLQFETSQPTPATVIVSPPL
jgi:thiamine biosynthesis lipoprotein